MRNIHHQCNNVNGVSIVFLSLLVFIAAGCKNAVTEPEKKSTNPTNYDHYTLVWNDEFDGTGLDLSKWNYETGTGVNGDFGTGQLDRATDRAENVSIIQGISGAEGGCLSIATRKERYIDRDFTSGRVTTQGKGSWGPGHRIEARVWTKEVLFKGQGFAFWMMPSEKPAGQNFIMWPQGGEIDILEYVGSIPYHNLGSVHYAWSWLNNEWAEWNHGHKGSYYSFETQAVPFVNPEYGGYPPLPNDSSAGSNAFHIFGIDWYSEKMEFSVDGKTYHIHYFNDGDAFENGVADGQDKEGVITIDGKRRMLSEYSNHFPEWRPFEHLFFIILSAGVGGNDNTTYGGAIIPEAVFPCSVYVDWVRVYKRND